MTRTRRTSLTPAEVLLATDRTLSPAKRAALLPYLEKVHKIIRSFPPAEAEAWLRMGERIAAGVPFAEAEADFKTELARLRA